MSFSYIVHYLLPAKHDIELISCQLEHFQLYALGQTVLKMRLFYTHWTIFYATCSFKFECMLLMLFVLIQPLGCCNKRVVGLLLLSSRLIFSTRSTFSKSNVSQTTVSTMTSVVFVVPSISAPCKLRYLDDLAGSGVESIDPLHFLARCRKRRLNQAKSLLFFRVGFF